MPGATVRQIAQGGVLLALAGVAIGIGLSILTADLVKSFLWRVDTSDPITYISAAVFILIVAALASVGPAVRILKLNPAQTLRD
jgi:putative ABC transport system permease protein